MYHYYYFEGVDKIEVAVAEMIEEVNSTEQVRVRHASEMEITLLLFELAGVIVGTGSRPG